MKKLLPLLMVLAVALLTALPFFINGQDDNAKQGEALLKRTDCYTCHNNDKRTVGPSYKQVAEKYPKTDETINTLAERIIKGNKGVWGEAVMTPHADLNLEDVKKMVHYVLSLGEYKNENLRNGLLARFWEINKPISNMAQVDFTKAPNFVAIVPTINFVKPSDFGGLGEGFAMEITGFLNIKTSTKYDFRLYSDDGGQLFIDNKMLINHDGEHGDMPKDAEIELSEGKHTIKILYFQSRGGKRLSLHWNPHGAQEFTVIDADSFTCSESNVKENDKLLVNIAESRHVPGDGIPLKDVHPSFDLSQARPDDFKPMVGGMDFMPDGKLAVSTWDSVGGVYLLENVQSGDPKKIKVKRFAAGLAEPLGLKVVDGDIYVLQKQELTRLIDYDKDGEADEYQTVCNSWRVSTNFHEFAFGLVYKDGWFYFNLAIGIQPGGASAENQPIDRGKVVRVNKESGKMEFFAAGYRTPNGIGIGVDNELFASDNQGDWLPSSKILHISQNAFFGSQAVNPDSVKNLTVKQPVVWLPQDEIGNSPSQPSYLNEGIYKGQMIHGEVTHGGVKRVFVEKIKGEYQGCVFRFTQGLEAGINRLVWGNDGALYVGGIGNPGNWGHADKKWYGLQRLKFNNKSTFEMLAVRAKTNGIEIEFTEALPVEHGWESSSYAVKQWRYVPTINYGGPKIDETRLDVKSATVSDDRKKVFLELAGMKAGHLVYVRLIDSFISEKNQQLWTTEGWYTMNNIPENQLGTVKAAPYRSVVNQLSPNEQKEGWKLLFDGKTTNGLRNFKKTTINKEWKVENGALHLSGGGGGDIVISDAYENFEFKIEWKISRAGNSGIFYGVSEGEKLDNIWQSAPEMQVLDNERHQDGQYPTHRAGANYDLQEPAVYSQNAVGEWNKARIVCYNGHVEHWLNGYKLCEYEWGSETWKKMVAKSKFKDMPDYGQTRNGKIGLQDHSDKVWFRNIKIRTLNAPVQ